MKSAIDVLDAFDKIRRAQRAGVYAPQHGDILPAPEFLAWHVKNVFKAPARQERGGNCLTSLVPLLALRLLVWLATAAPGQSTGSRRSTPEAPHPVGQASLLCRDGVGTKQKATRLGGFRFAANSLI
jgi:hypothetical protein